MPAEHDLKTWPPFFARLLTGEKTFELRRNDRGFAAGDLLLLREWDPDLTAYTGRVIRADVVEVFRAEDVPEGLEAGFAVLQVRVRTLESRDVVTAVQALQGWLCHHDHCGAVHQAACDERPLDPHDEGCTCGLADEWRRRFFPLGTLGLVVQALVDGLPFHRRHAEALPLYWREGVLELAKRLGIDVLPLDGPPPRVVKDDPRA